MAALDRPQPRLLLVRELHRQECRCHTDIEELGTNSTRDCAALPAEACLLDCQFSSKSLLTFVYVAFVALGIDKRVCAASNTSILLFHSLVPAVRAEKYIAG